MYFQRITSILRKIPAEYLMLGLAYFFWGTSQSLLRIENNTKPISDGRIIVIVVVQAILFFIANLLVIYCYIKIKARTKSTARQYIFSILATAAIALFFAFITLSIYRYGYGQPKILKYFAAYLINAFEKFISYTSFGAMFFLIRNLREYQKQKLQVEEIQEAARNTQLQTLQQQLNPNFLFDTLHSLDMLVVTDESKAREMVTDLSDFLRLTLASNRTMQNTVQDEISLLEAYFRVQKARLGEGLVYTFNIQEETKSITVPKFIFQLLVENAMKYAILASISPLEFSVSARQTSTEIILTVSNKGNLASIPETQLNIEKEKIERQLKAMFPTGACFSLSETKGWSMARICIDLTHRT